MSLIPTFELSTSPGPWASMWAVLRAQRKRPGPVQALNPVRWVRPSVTLDAQAIAAYTRVCACPEEQGVPLLYPQMLTFPLVMAYLASADCPWPAMGTVHLANHVQQHAPLHAGDDLRIELHSGQLQAHDKGQVFTLDFQVFKQDQLVWTATQTLLRLGVSQAAGTPYESAVEATQALSLQTMWNVGSNIGRRYGRVSGDMNPIHLSTLSAKLLGFRRAIAHGMWTQARALSAMLPRQALAQAEVLTEFKTPLFLPARASLWSAPMGHEALRPSAWFEVRNARGDKPHLRARLRYQVK